MAISKKTTCISVLRHLTPLTAKEFGALVSRKVDWMKRIESGNLPLRVGVARLIAYETGVSLDWLLCGDHEKQCLDWNGAPYTAGTFVKYRMKLASERPDQLCWCNPSAFLPMICSIARAAADKYQVELFADDLAAALDKLAARYGQNHEGGNACQARMAKHPTAFNLAVSEKRDGEETDALREFSDLTSKFLRDSVASGLLRTGRLAALKKPERKQKITIALAKDGAHARASMVMRKAEAMKKTNSRKRPPRKSQG